MKLTEMTETFHDCDQLWTGSSSQTIWQRKLDYSLLSDEYQSPTFVDKHKVDTSIFGIKCSVPYDAGGLNCPPPQVQNSSAS